MNKLAHFLMLAAVCLPVAAPAVDPGPAASGILALALETREARLAGDNARWLELAREVQAHAPEHPDLLISLARAYAANGRVGESIPWLERAIARGAGFDLFAFPEYREHADDAALAALVARATANQAPVSPPEEYLVIENTEIRPEGISWDADSSRLFIGSLNGEIWAIGQDRKLSRFAGPDSGLREVLGMKVDHARRLLWTVTGVFPDLFGSSEAPKLDVGLTAVVAFDLDSGKRVRECRLDERPVLHGFNDLALAANGDVYVSDTTANSIWRLPRGECRLEVVIRDSRMGVPNGIALSADEKLLYVAHIEGLSAVDLATGRRTQLPVPENASVNSMDGLVRDGDDLIGIQPTPYLARVVRIRLSGDGLAVREAVTVSSRPPPGVSQTTGTVAGAHYYSVAGAIDSLQAYAGGDGHARVLRSRLVPAAGAGGTANPQARLDVLVKQRKAAMTLQGKYFGPLVGMQRGTSPYDAQLIVRNAKYLEALAGMPWDGFEEGTRDQESRALPAIWSDQPKFRASIDEFQAAVAALAAAADRGHETDVKTTIEMVGNACRSCHDRFRRE